MGMSIESRGAFGKASKGLKTLSKTGLDQGAGMTGCRTIGHDAQASLSWNPVLAQIKARTKRQQKALITRISSLPNKERL
jgi:hypothetical protein